MALSFDGIAKAAGVSKGGVQSAFGTKEALLAALYEYPDGGCDQRFRVAQEQGVEEVGAYIDAVLGADDAVTQRIASLSVAMTQEPESRAYLSKWYAKCFPALSADTAQGRREILRLCALDGAMMLRSMRLLPLQDGDWPKILAELKGLDDELS